MVVRGLCSITSTVTPLDRLPWVLHPSRPPSFTVASNIRFGLYTHKMASCSYAYFRALPTSTLFKDFIEQLLQHSDWFHNGELKYLVPLLLPRLSMFYVQLRRF